ncbi:Glycosyltransferase involved in cell wall bisynthesis [Pseudoxanthomonas sp. GM95]|uniref:glycosyltransferase family 4 protein n=1 Tax=Pseudoxanthomonas sp. GM95 TaxID=1881043 RepID=UPI0008D336B8|nr:glycosyltransferase family 1 protein [Pseudoxanthomonas sp. GM95]SEM45328.1 Glycosyltransferase involved in cell wall bisynthesis [Pseudoxanthomonas sp. GM95]
MNLQGTTQGSARRISFNGKFLTSTHASTGVQRVAQQLIVALDQLLVENQHLASKLDVQLIVPGDETRAITLGAIRISGSSRFSRWFKSIPWEHLVLPIRARGSTLINLCNLGPVAKFNAYTMMHDAQVHSSPASYSWKFATWYRLIQPMLGRANRRILTVSHFSKKQLVQYRVADADRISVIHNGCDHVLEIQQDTDILQRLALQPGRYVVALSTLQAHKNIPVLLRAFADPRLAEITLVLFGSISRTDFERSGHAVPPSTVFPGRLTDEQMTGLIANAGAFAFPSLTEGFGLPPLEAMALGCPVVAAPCGALPETCGDAAVYADAGRADAWVDALASIISDPALADGLRAKGRAHASDFSWRRAAYALLELILPESRLCVADHAAHVGGAIHPQATSPQ